MRFTSVSLLVLLTAFFASSTGAGAAETSKERDLGTFGAWRTSAYDEGGQSVCYMSTTKMIKSSGPKKRTAPYMMITHRPVEASTDVFSYGAGAVLDTKHGVNIQIGKDVFDLFSARDTAWARDSLTDHKLAAALRGSARAQISAIPSQGGTTTITDVFDLTGALEAYRAINKACGLPDVATAKPALKKAPVKAPTAKKPVAAKAATHSPTAQKQAVHKATVSKPAAKKTTPKKPAKPNTSN